MSAVCWSRHVRCLLSVVRCLLLAVVYSRRCLLFVVC